ncbi:MAG: hypothetical protein AAGC44_03935 [Planctomycetota bacterium]
MPDPLHLYMLVAGMALGILLGPAVLGKASPGLYDKLFIGTGDTRELDQAKQNMADFEENNDYSERVAKVNKQAEFFDPNDSTALSVKEEILRLTNEYALEREEHQALFQEALITIELRRNEHTEKLEGLVTLLLLLTVVVMLVEPLLSPSRSELDETGRAEIPAALPRLITLRYALIAGWVSFALAKPVWLLSISPVFAIILAALVGVAAFVPLGKSKPSSG